MTTKAEVAHLNRLHRLGCIVCHNQGHQSEPEIHHPRYLVGAGQRASHWDAIPLCPIHHRIGGYRVAIHAGRKAWEAIHGKEAELLEQVKRLLGIADPYASCPQMPEEGVTAPPIATNNKRGAGDESIPR